MRLGKYGLLPIMVLALMLLFPYKVLAEEESVGNLFIQAYDAKDKEKMMELIKTRTEEFPPEVQEMVGYAVSPGVNEQESDFIFHIAFVISEMYATETKDSRMLEAVKMNYVALMEKRKGSTLPRVAVDKTKKELAELGKGMWRITIFKLDRKGDLDIEIEVRQSSGSGSFTPQISLTDVNSAKDIVVKNLPKIKKGKLLWSSMGVGLRTVFID